MLIICRMASLVILFIIPLPEVAGRLLVEVCRVSRMKTGVRNSGCFSAWWAEGASSIGIDPACRGHGATKTHVHGFCAAGQDAVGQDAQGGAIVGLDWGGGLFVAQFVEEG
jgi:hypothetical protein